MCRHAAEPFGLAGFVWPVEHFGCLKGLNVVGARLRGVAFGSCLEGLDFVERSALEMACKFHGRRRRGQRFARARLRVGVWHGSMFVAV